MENVVGSRIADSLEVINDYLMGKTSDLSLLESISELKPSSKRQIKHEALKIAALGGISSRPFKSQYQLRAYKALITPNKYSQDKLHLLVKDSNLIKYEPRIIQMSEMKYLSSILTTKELQGGYVDFNIDVIVSRLPENISLMVICKILFSFLNPLWSLRPQHFDDILHILSDRTRAYVEKYRKDCKFILVSGENKVSTSSATKNTTMLYTSLCYVTIRYLMDNVAILNQKLKDFDDLALHSISEAIYSECAYKFTQKRMEIKG